MVDGISSPSPRGGGAQAGHEVVPDVARRLGLRATVQGHVQASLSHPVAEASADRLNRPPASPNSGEFEAAIVAELAEEMSGETLCPPPD